MENTKPLEIIREGLGGYQMAPVIAEAIKFILANRYESMVIVDEKGKIEFIDHLTEKFFNLSPGQAKGKGILEIIPFSELPEVLSTGTPHIGRITKIKNRHTVISRFPLFKDGKIVGAFGRVILHSFEELERLKERGRTIEVRSFRCGEEDKERISSYIYF